MKSRAAVTLCRLGRFLDRADARQFLVYGLSIGGTMAVGFILPLILMRVLPAETYGGLVLFKALLPVVIGIAGMGLSQAAVCWGGLEEREPMVLGTVLGGALFAALPAAVFIVTLIMIFASQFKILFTIPLLISGFILVFSYIINNEFVNWLRARHQAKRYAFVNTLRALEQMVAIVAGVALVRNAAGYIYGLALGELLFLGWMVYGSRTKFVFDSKLLVKMLRYGWPHTIVIVSGVLLNYADRYMLFFITNNNLIVAYYDAAYILVASAIAILARPFNLYMFPAYIKRYEEEGAASAVKLVNKAQKLFLIAGLCVSTILVLLRDPLMNLLFPVEYSKASSIFVFVAYAMMLNGIFIATVAGLNVSKKTVLVGIAAIVAVLSNILANWILIPIYGINGAALGTTISSLVQLIVGYYYSRSVLPVDFPFWLLFGSALWLGFVNWLVS